MTLEQIIIEKVNSVVVTTNGGEAKQVLDVVSGERGEYIVPSGADKDNRPKLVTLQAAFEASLAAAIEERKVRYAVGVIHTPLPATPCRTKGAVTEGLVHPDVATDPARLKTVTTRANIVRDFLNVGGRLICLYSNAELKAAQDRARTGDKSDRPKVTEESMQIFKDLQAKNSNLIDRGTDIPSFSDEHSGATYLVEDHNGNRLCFSIRAYQANTPADGKTWGIWAGDPAQKPAVAARLSKVTEFLTQQGIDLNGELNLSSKLRPLGSQKTPPAPDQAPGSTPKPGGQTPGRS